MSRLYPIGIQNFEKIRKEGYCYVDKTELIYKLVKTGQYYFLSRPRRFGKSLLISTLESYFHGKSELFEGLAIEKLENEWKRHPVLHLDLNTQKYDNTEKLNNVLNNALCKWEKVYGREESETDLPLRFQGIIERASKMTGQNVVILIDEYDKPMLQAIGNGELMDSFRNTLKAFYAALKSCDRYIRFAILTGVTRFSKVSVFSDLNNLMDISMDDRFANICGITESELYMNFSDDIAMLAEKYNTAESEIKIKLKELYDGYHFTEACEDLYNPFSLLNTFARAKFGNYWFDSGTPTFLVELLKQSRYDLHDLSGVYSSSESLGNIDTMYTNPVPVMFQSGYLTIKGYDSEFDMYELGFPNREVEEGFTKYLFPYYASLRNGNSAFEISNFVKDVRNGETESFMNRLKSFFSDTPYVLVRDLELHYQNVLFIVFKLLGFYTLVEYQTSNGRIDMVVKTDDYIYVMEFKLEGSAEDAINQINERNYVLPFRSDKRTVYKIGVNFSNKTRNIEKWIVERVGVV